MRFGIIGDIIGRVGREAVCRYLPSVREKYQLDVVIANGENASAGFGLTCKNAIELLGYGINVITGGNHTWDKKEIASLLSLEHSNILRPQNYPKSMPGSGLFIGEVQDGRVSPLKDEKTQGGSNSFAVLNLMGHFGMPHCDNAFVCAKEVVEKLRARGIYNILMDFHAEATSEKRTMLFMLESQVSAVLGTHTHIGTDDLEIYSGTLGVSDVGGSGARDGVIGMEAQEPINRFLTGISSRFSVPKPEECRHVFQMIVLETNESGKCLWATKLKAVDDGELQETLQAI